MNYFKRAWDGLGNGLNFFFGPINPNEEDQFQKATRFKLALGASLVLGVVFLVSFVHALWSPNIVRVELFLQFAQNIAITLASMISVYLGARSLRGRGPFIHKELTTHEEAPEDGPMGFTALEGYDPKEYGSEDPDESNKI